eukprot:2875967-Amphidinium_carterae.1
MDVHAHLRAAGASWGVWVPLLCDPRLPLQPRCRVLRAAVRGSHSHKWTTPSWALCSTSLQHLAAMERRCAIRLRLVPRLPLEPLADYYVRHARACKRWWTEAAPPLEHSLLVQHAQLLGHSLRHCPALYTLLHAGSRRETEVLREWGVHLLRVGRPRRLAAAYEEYSADFLDLRDRSSWAEFVPAFARFLWSRWRVAVPQRE